jgi:hypothetical protein
MVIMNKCFMCKNYIHIPDYLRKEYTQLGVDLSAKTICCITRNQIDGQSNTCSEFIEDSIDDE